MTTTGASTAGRSTTNTTFTIERRIAAPPAKVYRAFADAEAKQKWFGGDQAAWQPEIRQMDFRVGGQERVRGKWHNGPVSDFRATYHDIVENDRIVYVYDMYVDDKKLSVSLATIQLTPDGDGTRFVLTEQGVFFDGLDDAARRESGTVGLVDAMERSVTG